MIDAREQQKFIKEYPHQFGSTEEFLKTNDTELIRAVHICIDTLRNKNRVYFIYNTGEDSKEHLKQFFRTNQIFTLENCLNEMAIKEKVTKDDTIIVISSEKSLRAQRALGYGAEVGCKRIFFSSAEEAPGLANYEICMEVPDDKQAFITMSIVMFLFGELLNQSL